jgi:acetyl-CoA synthetase
MWDIFSVSPLGWTAIVAIYLPTSPIAVAAMLACARIGAIHSVVFAGFSSDALADRINDGEKKILDNDFQNYRTKTNVSLPLPHTLSSF